MREHEGDAFLDDVEAFLPLSAPSLALLVVVSVSVAHLWCRDFKFPKDSQKCCEYRCMYAYDSVIQEGNAFPFPILW